MTVMAKYKKENLKTMVSYFTWQWAQKIRHELFCFFSIEISKRGTKLPKFQKGEFEGV